MTEIDLGPHFDGFVREQIDSGRFRDAAEVVRAGLSLLEEREGGRLAHREALLREIGDVFDDPTPGRPAEDVFEGLERRHAARIGASPRDA